MKVWEHLGRGSANRVYIGIALLEITLSSVSQES